MLENLALAVQGVWSHKLRSFLTMLGIIIGIASIITIVSTIKGTNEQIKENLIGAGTNTVKVELYQDEWIYEWAYNGVPDGVSTVQEETRQSLLEIENVEDVSLFCQRSYSSELYYKNTVYNGAVYGIDEHYFNTCGYKLSYGRSFLPEDFSSFRKVAMLDMRACSSLFAGAYPVGEVLEIGGEVFTVIGVVEKINTVQLSIETVSDYYTYADTGAGTVFIPLADWPIVYGFDEAEGVMLRAATTDAMTRIGQQAEDILTASQITRTDNTFSYKSEDLMEQAEQLQALSNSTNRQLLWIASISLLVGGIGVMNIMLVTVTERTREIGLKKAIGARKRRILWQFLTEAATLTSIGGLLGVVAGIVFSRVVSSLSGTPSSISLPASAVAVVFSIGIGILFGMIPAVKAANLNPIEALRRE